jgi:ketosteroid isomerase-like protein
MKRQKRGMTALFLMIVGLLCWTKFSWAQDRSSSDQQRIAALLAEMKTTDLASMQPIQIQPFTLPSASVDVMRVKLEETYDVVGIGTDTVQLYGWVAVAHDNARPARGETEIRWDTTISQTEFVGMDLNGESKIFGPVHVELTPGVRSIGQVGKLDLSMVDQVLVSIAYMPYRPSGYGSVMASSVPEPTARQSLQLIPAAVVTDEETKGRSTGSSEAAVKKTLVSVLNAISEKNPEGMLKHYSRNTENTFFNGSLSSPAKGGDEYIHELSKMFENIRSIRALPDEKSIRLKVSGNLASASLTGRNEVVDNDGNKGTSSWAWTVELQKDKGVWTITHDHLMFTGAGEVATDVSKIRTPAKCCAANAAVTINMPQLNLHMQTERPVMWYSEVETIPPVGHTASVSFTPTGLITDGRRAATLTSGVVKFREVVRRVQLQGTRPGEMMAASDDAVRACKRATQVSPIDAIVF